MIILLLYTVCDVGLPCTCLLPYPGLFSFLVNPPRFMRGNTTVVLSYEYMVIIHQYRKYSICAQEKNNNSSSHRWKKIQKRKILKSGEM